MDQSDIPEVEPETVFPKNRATSRRKRLAGRIALGVVGVGAIYGAYALVDYRAHGRYIQETEDAYVRADGVAVSSKLAGYVRAVNVRDNQAVSAGALLVQIDPTDYRTRLSQAAAQVEVARATGDTTSASISEARAAVGQARAARDAARRELAFLSGEVTRLRPLAASGAEPAQALDQVIANRDKAAADLAGRIAALTSAQARIGTLEAQVRQSAAQVRAAETQRAAAGNDVATTRITAPVSGTVASTSVRLGQFVQPGQRLLTIVPANAIYIEANFKETQIGLMRPGLPVKVEVDALPDVEFHGTVESITPGTGASFSLVPPQNATGNFTKIVQRVPVRIRIDPGPQARRVMVPGLSVSVRVDTSGNRSTLDAIRREQQRTRPGQ